MNVNQNKINVPNPSKKRKCYYIRCKAILMFNNVFFPL